MTRWRGVVPSLCLLIFLASCAVERPAPVGETPTFTQTGLASWYGRNHHGKTTANGETFDTNGMTAAHRSLPFGTIVRVTNIATNQVIKVRINDRGPYVRDRIIDLSSRAARELGIREGGTARVRIERYASDQPSAQMTGG